MEGSYATLSYRDLQKLCKTHGLMCKGKTAELRARLVAHVAAEQGEGGDLSAAAPQAGTDSDEGEAAQHKKQEENSNEKKEQLVMVMDVGIEKAEQADEETAAAPTAFPARAPGEDMFPDMPDLVAQPTAAAATAAVEGVQEVQEAEEMEGSMCTALNVIKRKAETGEDASAASTTKNSSNTTVAETDLPKKVPKLVSMLRKPSPASVFATQGSAAMQGSAAGGGGAGAGRATMMAAAPVSSTKKATTMKTTSSSSTTNKKKLPHSGPRPFGPGTFSLSSNSSSSSNHHKASFSSSSKTTITNTSSTTAGKATAAAAAAAAAAPFDPSKPRPKPTYKPHTGKLPPYKGKMTFFSNSQKTFENSPGTEERRLIIEALERRFTMLLLSGHGGNKKVFFSVREILKAFSQRS
eukprot:evm.model.NODE_1193_length_18015_cov_29.075548.3